jgi:hypothetical protein
MSFIHTPIRSEEHWHQLRGRRVTASVIGALFDVHPYVTRYALWASKVGRLDAEPESEILRDGRILEPAVIELIRHEHPSWIIDYPLQEFVSDDDAPIGATPDARITRFDRDGRGTLQLKTVGEHAFRREWIDDEGQPVLPTWIGMQTLVEAILDGNAWAQVSVMVVGRPLALHHFDVPVDVSLYAQIQDAARAFWRFVESGNEPPIDWEKESADVIAAYSRSDQQVLDMSHNVPLLKLIYAREAATKTRRQAERDLERLNAQLLQMIGAAEVVMCPPYRITARSRAVMREDGTSSVSRPIHIKEKNHDA